MPGLAGAELLARVAMIRPHCRRVVVTGFPESDELIAASLAALTPFGRRAAILAGLAEMVRERDR